MGIGGESESGSCLRAGAIDFPSSHFTSKFTMDAQKQLQALSEEFQGLQTELEVLVDARQKLESQQQENEGVQTEFAYLDDESNIYKLVGPVLLKQDKTEAIMAVNGRLEFIEKEIKRIEAEIDATQEKSEKMRSELIQLQSQAQQQGAAASASA
ncbi:Prefoldin [Penicillium samsonianum]|uniref:Prefoldin n=1 Tax=Penicillium samsonianum TaxID=1882272 RepID=UPI0025491529|nr:Prefoldin [Penicillium samsonianum]KAJ6138566.1 Prefoldin [Penicillium samsonianum]